MISGLTKEGALSSGTSSGTGLALETQALLSEVGINEQVTLLILEEKKVYFSFKEIEKGE